MHIEPEQAARYVPDAWEGPIAEFLQLKHRCTVGDVACLGLGFDTSRLATADQRRITKVLEILGWRRAKHRGTGGARWWVAPGQADE